MSKWEPREKRIEDIVNAAIEIFLEKGYEGTSMEAIANRAQISKGGLYHHFKSKEEILYYANEKLSEPIGIYMESAASNQDVVEGLKSYIRNYLEHWISHPREMAFFFLAMTKALECAEMWDMYGKYYDDTEGFLRGLFERGIQEGKFIGHNVKESSVALMSALDGIIVYLVMNRKLNKDEIIGLLQEKFVMSLVKKG